MTDRRLSPHVLVDTINGPAPFPVLRPVHGGLMAIDTLHGGTTWLPVIATPMPQPRLAARPR
jgi:hypothetical protein